MAPAVSLPRVPTELDPFDLDDGASLYDELELERVHVTGRGGEALSIRSLELIAAHLDDVALDAGRLFHLGLRDCRTTGGSFANLLVRGGTAQRSSFERVRMTGLSWHEGTLRDVTFSGCRLDLASFAATRLERVRFEDCVLTEAELQDARLAAVVFEGCDLSGIDLSGARFTAGCELRGCILDGARQIERLRGVRMPLEDVIGAAGTFAGALGISVIHDEEDER